MSEPIITLLTDFGCQDGYVASMKGVILSIAPTAGLIDISHLIEPRDIRSAAFVLFTCYHFFPANTIHVAIVDPGVGTDRRAIAVRTPSCTMVGPDNGIFSLVLMREKRWEARNLDNPGLHLERVSMTFHGRDVFSPVAAHLANGTPFETLGSLCSPVCSPWIAPIEGVSGIEGEVIHIDRFGNAITNVKRETLVARAPIENWSVQVTAASNIPIEKTYGRTLPGSILALEGSSGFIEIAVNQGNAASLLGLQTSSSVGFRLSSAT
ncbi:MAG: SAM-dependent chlorinase/fluorinase [Syntrophobacteraceae bacterium]